MAPTARHQQGKDALLRRHNASWPWISASRAVFAEVIHETIHTPDDNAALGQRIRDVFRHSGGAEALQDRYTQVSTYHHNNYRPLL